MNRIEKALDYIYGNNREKMNVKKAVELLEEEKDNPIAICFLVSITRNFPHLHLNYQMSNEIFRRLLEMESIVLAQNCIGYCYQYGVGVENDSIGIYWYTLSATQGNSIAQHNLGYEFERREDVVRANRWYNLSANQGNAYAQGSVGNYYYNAKKDYGMAVHYFTLSSEQGHRFSQYNLARCYERGDGVDQDLDKAIYWYTLSAEQGLDDSKKSLERLIKPIIPMAQISSLKEEKNSECPDMMCSICTMNVKNIVFLPCRHVVSCLGCTKGLAKKNCPLCRKEIKEIVKLFL